MLVEWAGKAVGLFDHRTVANQLNVFLQAETMLVQVTPFSESPRTVTFDLRGFQQASQPVAEACIWR